MRVRSAPVFRGGAYPSPIVPQALGIAAILLQAAIMTGAVLLVVTAGAERSLRGSVTIIFAINGTLMGLLRDQPGLIRRAVASGLACDLLLKRPNASFARPRALRHFAFAVPASCTWLYFLTPILDRGAWWSLHLWSGAIVTVGWQQQGAEQQIVGATA